MVLNTPERTVLTAGLNHLSRLTLADTLHARLRRIFLALRQLGVDGFRRILQRDTGLHEVPQGHTVQRIRKIETRPLMQRAVWLGLRRLHLPRHGGATFRPVER